MIEKLQKVRDRIERGLEPGECDEVYPILDELIGEASQLFRENSEAWTRIIVAVYGEVKHALSIEQVVKAIELQRSKLHELSAVAVDAQRAAEEAQQIARDSQEAAFALQQDAAFFQQIVYKQSPMIDQLSESLQKANEATGEAIRAATNWRLRAQAAERIATKAALPRVFPRFTDALPPGDPRKGANS